jgi:hypothetical protein
VTGVYEVIYYCPIAGCRTRALPTWALPTWALVYRALRID